MGTDNMIRLAIYDNDSSYVNELVNKIENGNMYHAYNISVFDNADEILTEKYKFDAMFINIDTDEGMRIAETLKLEYNIPIVFMSIYDLKVDSYIKVRPFSFMKKNYNDDELDDILTSLEHFINRILRRHVVNLYCHNGKQSVFIEDIVYAEIYPNQIIFHMEDKSVITCIALMKEYNEIWEKEEFVRCQRRYIINCSKICELDFGDAVFSNGDRIQISRQRLKEVRDIYKRCTGREQ